MEKEMKAIIRKAVKEDCGRMAEIIVFNNRLNYYPIFQDIAYSFKEFNVLSVAEDYAEDPEFLSNTWVLEDEVIWGFLCVKDGEVVKLYVDSFFQGRGIGQKLLDFAVEEQKAIHLWALEKNTKALAFYERNGFLPDGKICFEEGTTEHLLHLVRKNELRDQ